MSDDPPTMADEIAQMQRVVEAGQSHGVLLWWVVLVDRATKPSGILCASIHENPVPRLRKLWKAVDARRADVPTWKMCLAPLNFEGTEEELAVLVTLPRDCPLVLDAGETEDLAREYSDKLTADEKAVIGKIVVRDLAKPRPYLKRD